MGRGRKLQRVGRPPLSVALVVVPAEVAEEAGPDDSHVEVISSGRRYRVSRYGGSSVLFQAAEWDADDRVWFNPLHRASDEGYKERETRCYTAIRAAYPDELTGAAWRHAKRSAGSIHLPVAEVVERLEEERRKRAKRPAEDV